jgi:hypothetical protein
MVESGPIDAMASNARFSLPKQMGWALAMMATWAIVFLGCPYPSQAEPLDYDPFVAGGPQFFFSQTEGRMGFNQDVGENGTLNDLQTDLGLPTNNQTYRILTSIRPLEHHNLRFYFSIPEVYKGSKVLNRNLVTRTVIYPAGSQISSELRTGMIGFGYDCDFLITPRLFAGLNGDLRYIDIRVKLGQNQNSWEDTFSIDELAPCLGAHFQTALPLRKCLNAGVFGRVTYAITPNFLNYVDAIAGLRLGSKALGQVALDAKAGFEHESMFQELERSSGRRLELKRTGIVFSVEATF